MTPDSVLRMLRAVLRWVHISDLHFGHGKAGAWADREIVLQQLIQDATELKRNLGAPHALFVTGDIAFSGKQKEYDDARLWLDRLLLALDLKPEQVFLVPGNHDNDRGKVGSVLHQKIRSDPGQGVDAAVVDKKNKKPLLAKQAAYQKFAQRYHSAEVWYQRPLSSSLGPVQVLGLNSALASFDGDDKPTNLALGARQRKLILDQPDDTLVLVLQHHPTEWLIDGPDQQGLQGQRPHILFTGHVHVPGGGAQTNLMGHESWVIRAGAAHSQEKPPEPFVYAWGELSAEGFNYYPRVWFGGGTSQFKADQRANVDSSGKVTIGREKLPDRVQKWLLRPGPLRRPVHRLEVVEVASPKGVAASGVIWNHLLFTVRDNFCADAFVHGVDTQVRMKVGSKQLQPKLLWEGGFHHDLMVVQVEQRPSAVVPAVAAPEARSYSIQMPTGSWVEAEVNEGTEPEGPRWQARAPGVERLSGLPVWQADAWVGITTRQEADTVEVCFFAEVVRDRRLRALLFGEPPVNRHLGEQVDAFLREFPAATRHLARRFRVADASVGSALLGASAKEQVSALEYAWSKENKSRLQAEASVRLLAMLLPWSLDLRDPRERARTQTHLHVRATNLAVVEAAVAGAENRPARWRAQARELPGFSCLSETVELGFDASGAELVAETAKKIAAQYVVQPEQAGLHSQMLREKFQEAAALDEAADAEPPLYLVLKAQFWDDDKVKFVQDKLPGLQIVRLEGAPEAKNRDYRLQVELHSLSEEK